jgi:hypothetical protein
VDLVQFEKVKKFKVVTFFAFFFLFLGIFGLNSKVKSVEPASKYELSLSTNNASDSGTASNESAVTCNNGAGVSTAIGCIPVNDQNALVGFFLRWGVGIGGGIAFLLILLAGFQIITSRGDPNRLKAGQELMTSAIAGLLLLIFSVIILKIIGFDILRLPIFSVG